MGVYLDENGEIQCDFVEVDESQICNRKYNRGRLYNTESQKLWVVGGVCRIDLAKSHPHPPRMRI